MEKIIYGHAYGGNAEHAIASSETINPTARYFNLHRSDIEFFPSIEIT